MEAWTVILEFDFLKIEINPLCKSVQVHDLVSKYLIHLLQFHPNLTDIILFFLDR